MSKTASMTGIALAGGGPLGAIYEIGACAALNEAIVGFELTQADVYVGVSAGAFIASGLANGIDPLRLSRILLDRDVKKGVFDPKMLLHPALGEYGQRLRALPKLVWEAAAQYFGEPLLYGLFESFERLLRVMPSGVFDNNGIERVLTQLYSEPGRTNDFRQLRSQLYLVATDLDSAKSMAFGSPGHDDVSIAKAVQASAALPGLFPPVPIKGRHYVDGALIKTLHASIALKAGANLLICVNPLVPFDASLAEQRGVKRPHKLADGGLPVVLSQTFRAIIHSRMVVGMDRYKKEFPNADVLLFEPSQDDEAMFFANLFSYRDRRRLCEHAYQRTRQDLYRRRHELMPVLQRHGFDLDVAVLRDPSRSLVEHSRRLPRVSPGETTRRLDATLDELQELLSAAKAA